ncbi:MAG: ATP-grasp domain-containing protein [Pseudooceanicola sp.]|nr:ATP-grasp domain-containing protein [Pseudooceanicola sp.]
MSDYPIRKVLVANRGEIACRVFRALDQMGIASVAVFHAVEAKALHVRAAGEAVEITGDTPVAAHLDAAQIIAAAKATGADAIHPGYGFLSENATFARAVEAEGLIFVGPTSDSIALMGDKISSRDFAAAHGVPVAPSVLPTEDMDAFAREAAKIGFPLLIKASAGGGGKGMTIVRAESEVRQAARIASGEAQRYFGDGRVYAELYVERPRHVEVQVLGDGQGRVIHLHARDCSVQRRFQKIVEEAPPADLRGGLGDEICAAAVRLAEAANYRNAGTVEFILGADGRFFFLEMNTRLQVEHPVTEMITGVDLVRAQLDVAAGRGLPMAQGEVPLDGHSIECRICAEDAEADFMPAIGRLRVLDIPQAPWLRFEHGLTEGQAVTADFDPMLAKLVVHGADRAQAADRAIEALGRLSMLGVTTNIDYLMRVLASPGFRDSAPNTGFVAENAAALAAPAVEPQARDAVLAAAALGLPEFRKLIFEVPDLHAAIGHWRN